MGNMGIQIGKNKVTADDKDSLVGALLDAYQSKGGKIKVKRRGKELKFKNKKEK